MFSEVSAQHLPGHQHCLTNNKLNIHPGHNKVTFCQEKTFLKGYRITNLKRDCFFYVAYIRRMYRIFAKQKTIAKPTFKLRKRRSKSFLNSN